jgi:hypothetical protein
VKVAAKKGIATFSNVSIRKAGNYSIEALDGSYLAAMSNTFVVAPAAAAKIVFTVPPANVTHGNPFAVQVELLDRYGNVATNDSSSVTLSLGAHPKGAILAGTLNVAFSDGLAGFDDLSLSLAGKYTLIATDSHRIPRLMSKKFVVA